MAFPTKVGSLHIGTSPVAVTVSRGKLGHFTDYLYRTSVLDAFRRGHVIAQLDADQSFLDCLVSIMSLMIASISSCAAQHHYALYDRHLTDVERNIY